MDLRDLTDDNLGMLLQLFRQFSEVGGNRFFFDLYMVVEREGLSRMRQTEIQDYSEKELRHAVLQLKELVDSLRQEQIPDEHPLSRFVLLALTSALNEIERREKAAPVH